MDDALPTAVFRPVEAVDGPVIVVSIGSEEATIGILDIRQGGVRRSLRRTGMRSVPVTTQ